MQTTVDLIRAQAVGAPNWFDLEHNVNAAWNAIFQDPVTFPVNGRVLVHPEAFPKPNDTNGQRNDLLVKKATPVILPGPNNPPTSFSERNILCYEGKGQNSTDNWNDIRAQLQDFIRLTVGGRESSTGWGIGAKGTAVRFWRYQRKNPGTGITSGTGEWMVPLFVQNNVVVDNNIYSGALEYGLYNLNNGQHWADILLILREMATRDPRPQGNP